MKELCCCLLLLGSPLGAQGVQLRAVGSGLTAADLTAYQAAARLEVGGNPSAAIELLHPLLGRFPADIRFLQVADRAFRALDRAGDMLPLLAAGIRVDSTSEAMLRLAVGVFASNSRSDSVKKYVARWSALPPLNRVTPYKEWAEGASRAGDLQAAVKALEAGRAALGSEQVLAVELATARQRVGDFPGAVEEWLKAIRVSSNYRVSAMNFLAEVQLKDRNQVLGALRQHQGQASVSLQGLLLAGWGAPLEGAELVHSVLPGEPGSAALLIQDLLTRLDGDDPDSTTYAARARTLEWLADTQQGEAMVETRLEAARAYADAGEEAHSQRLLTQIASDRNAPADLTATATSALLGVYLAQGKAAEADATLGQIRQMMGVSEYNLQRRRVARLWMQRGDPHQAAALAEGDSTAAGIDLIGRVRLWQGDLVGAADAFRFAGPFDDDRSLAVSRLSILALLQAIGDSVSPEIGKVFLSLDRGDTLRALQLIEPVIRKVRPEGAAALRLYSAEMLLSLGGGSQQADTLLALADQAQWPGVAARARYLRADLLARTGDREAAVRLLEQLILDFPESAVLPEARRLRNEIRGAIPGVSH